MKKANIGRKKSKVLVENATNDLVISIEKFKETRDMAEVILIVNKRKVNLMELYREMWVQC